MMNWKDLKERKEMTDVVPQCIHSMVDHHGADLALACSGPSIGRVEQIGRAFARDHTLDDLKSHLYKLKVPKDLRKAAIAAFRSERRAMHAATSSSRTEVS